MSSPPGWLALWEALEESLTLQSHYATLLNDYDGGRRKTFNAKQWLARLRQLKERVTP